MSYNDSGATPNPVFVEANNPAEGQPIPRDLVGRCNTAEDSQSGTNKD